MRCPNRLVYRALLLLGPCLVPLAGCSSSERGLVPVSGKVTLDGGSWAKPGRLIFTPTGQGSAEGGAMRPSIADFGTDGQYTVSSYEGSPGLYPGEYKVAVECWEEEPGMANPNAAADLGKKGLSPGFNNKKIPMPGPGKSYVPEKYRSSEKSDLSVKVESGKPVTANFDVKSK